MFRLRWIIIPLWIACIAGAATITALSFGWYGVAPLAIAAGVGVLLGWPAGLLTTRYLRHHPEHGDVHQPTMRPDPRVRTPRPG